MGPSSFAPARRGLEWSEIAGQRQGEGEDPRDREETEHGTDEAGTRLRMQVHDTFMEGTETEMLGGGEDTIGAETTNTTPSFQEMEGTLSSEDLLSQQTATRTVPSDGRGRGSVRVQRVRGCGALRHYG